MQTITISAAVAVMLLCTACNESAKPNVPPATITTPVSNNISTEGKGPFGLEMGMSEQTMKTSVPGFYVSSRFIYGSTGAIKQNTLFSHYIYQVTNETGLCMIAAQTAEFATNDFGDQVRAKYKVIKTLMQDKYGPAMIEHDQLQAGSIWKDPKDFVTALKKGDRQLRSGWVGVFPNNIDSMTVSTEITPRGNAKINVGYIFKNRPECLKVINDYEKSNL